MESKSAGMVQVLVWYKWWYGTSGGMVQGLVWYKCWYGTSAGMVQGLVWYKGWYGTRAGMVQVLVWYKCWYGTRAGMVQGLKANGVFLLACQLQLTMSVRIVSFRNVLWERSVAKWWKGSHCTVKHNNKTALWTAKQTDRQAGRQADRTESWAGN